MRGTNRFNEIETRQLCKNICNLTGLSSLMTKHFLIIVQEALVHKVTEQALKCEKGQIEYTDIEIPFIGCLHIDFGADGTVKPSIELEDQMVEQLIKAKTIGESPLLNHIEESVVNNIINQYQMLL